MTAKFGPVFEFHISHQARDRYQIEGPLFSLHGNVILADFSAVRALAWKMNLYRDLARFPEQTVPAGALNGMGLIDEILHYVVGLYRRQIDPKIMADALLASQKNFSPRKINKVLKSFSGEFPPTDVYRGKQSLETYLKGRTGGVSHYEIVLEEMILLYLANRNPAFSPFRELFDDAVLKKDPIYQPMIDGVEKFFSHKPPFGPDRQRLMELLSAPAKAAPHSIKGQLEFIRTKWHDLALPFLGRILLAIDLLEEEARLPFGGPGISPVPDFLLESLETERYSLDRDWMPTLVLIAKSIYVWLFQLSRKYGRPITRLDQIPDEELDLLARWGFTGLWLIGLWERSPASMEIKQRTGNPEAAASAYSITDYSVAGDLGGREALMNLRHRAWQRGIRMAADMVPNHTGLDSRWMMEHPDWFIQLDHPPFPAYRFTGPDLSRNPGVGIFIEDGYWNRSEAAVVFKRVDKKTGQERFIYHGNDGTGLPWNDTAQLNFLRGEVREAVIGSILKVAADFPIIRFDAAMTLTKRHFLRLWFPPPGSGGAIPSRAGHGLPAEEFNRLFPNEFWREVVDRVAREASDTLLLAEAFWLLEGYFVRTLGMHRVYNSAFMNMLKAEHNAEYRQVIKNVLEFDPQILKRFVNFMNNPDEETAVAQFGKDDKYFGTAIMMVTLPGLPMFGHGQVEGFAERYGMEYRRSYWDEEPDQELIRRHEAEIFPLLKKRYLFSEVTHFTLYDLYSPDGTVDENVFAYSNRSGEERCLVLYNNKYRQATGWIRESTAVAETGPEGKHLVQRTLGQELGLTGNDNSFCVFRDAISGLQYIRPSRDIIDRGMWIDLGAFKHHVLLDFGTITDLTGEWAELNRFLNGRGVPNLQIALKELFLTPVLQSFRELISPQSIREWSAPLLAGKEKFSPKEISARIEEKAIIFLKAGATRTVADGDPAAIAARIRSDFETALKIGITIGGKKRATGTDSVPEPGRVLITSNPGQDIPFWRVLWSCLAVRRVGELATGRPDPLRSTALYGEWLLAREVERTLSEVSENPETAAREARLIGALVVSQGWLPSLLEGSDKMKAALEDLFRIPELQAYIGLHRYQGILWFIKEGFEEIISWLHLLACLEATAFCRTKKERLSRIETITTTAWGYLTAAERAGYRVDRLFELVGGKKQPD